ncbi:Hypothetical_protein [Hexamita inflata]|uniref:Hypothetical_protein n=1 Tax=Hexamita inflata TaxID=28002 RepID=A0AA86UNC2_9EUKA|nr:Hypothetical protein HINF_LOCUS33093 [Hexamita inflata]
MKDVYREFDYLQKIQEQAKLIYNIGEQSVRIMLNNVSMKKIQSQVQQRKISYVNLLSTSIPQYNYLSSLNSVQVSSSYIVNDVSMNLTQEDNNIVGLKMLSLDFNESQQEETSKCVKKLSMLRQVESCGLKQRHDE